MNRATLPVALVSALLLSACAAKGKASADAPSGGYGGEGASVTMAAPGDVASERAASEPMAVAADADEEAEPEPEFDRSIQAGTLTAGVFDDSKNPDVMRAFASHMRENQA